MSFEELCDIVSLAASKISAGKQGVHRWYLFGSVLSDFDNAADIDLLILANPESLLTEFRTELQEFCLSLPIHLLMSTFEEAEELSLLDRLNTFEVHSSESGIAY